MIAFLKEHYAQKKVKNVGSPSLISYLEKIDELLGPIAKQSLTSLLENTLVFGEDDFNICPESKDTACRVGILSQEDRITAIMDTHERHSHVQLPVFFPHKLFQEYMAGVYLASLYESDRIEDRNECNRLIEQVVLPRKEEFRYLLYFTVSQNKSIATHVMQSMLRGVYMGRFNIDFIVDVAFESLDPDVAALVKDTVSSEKTVLNIVDTNMTAHTVAGYAFICPHVVQLNIERDCGPSMSLDVAEMICSVPSLKEVFLQGAFHHCFFATLASKGRESKVETLTLCHVQCPTPAWSHHLAEALCSIPNLTDLALQTFLDEEFCCTFKANASSIKVKTLQLEGVYCHTTASCHHLAEALFYMPNLTDLVLSLHHKKEFFFKLIERAPSIKGCFPQIRKGNFRLNGVAQDDLNSFLYDLSRMQRSGALDVINPKRPRSRGDLADFANISITTDVHSPRRTLPPSDHPQQQPMGEIHSPRRTLPPSDHPQQHVGNTSDAVCQVSQTRREGSSSQSRPNKRQAPSTQSRVPQDDPEIPEKQSKV